MEHPLDVLKIKIGTKLIQSKVKTRDHIFVKITTYSNSGESYWYAAQSIQLNVNLNVLPNINVELNFRKVKIQSPLNTGLNSQIKINRRGCVE